MTKAKLPRWTTIPVNFLNSNTALEVKSRYGPEATDVLLQLFIRADPNGVHELNIYRVGIEAVGAAPKVVEQVIAHLEKEELLIRFTHNERELAVNTKHHLYHPRGAGGTAAKYIQGMIPAEVQQQVEALCPEAADRWWPEGLQSTIINNPKGQALPPRGAPKGQVFERKAPLRVENPPEKRPLGSRTRINRSTRSTRIQDINNTQPYFADGATAPKAAVTPVSKVSPKLSEIEDAGTAETLLAALLSMFEPYHRRVLLFYVSRCLGPMARKPFEQTLEPPNNKRMRGILRSFIDLVRDLRTDTEVTYHCQVLPRISTEQLVRHIYGAAKDSTAVIDAWHGRLKARILHNFSEDEIPARFLEPYGRPTRSARAEVLANLDDPQGTTPVRDLLHDPNIFKALNLPEDILTGLYDVGSILCTNLRRLRLRSLLTLTKSEISELRSTKLSTSDQFQKMRQRLRSESLSKTSDTTGDETDDV